MQITLNGQEQVLPPGVATLQQLLDYLHIQGESVATEVCHQIVSKKDRSAHVIQDKDVLEIITFVGGG